MKPLVIVGCGNMAKTLAPYLKEKYQLVGYALDKKYISSETYEGLPVYPFESIEAYLDPEDVCFAVAIGFQDMNLIRESKFNEMKAKGFQPAQLVLNPRIEGHGVEVAKGSIILEHTSIHAGSVIGENTFISTGVDIGHNCKIGKNVWINSGVTIAGDVEIGDNSVLGVGATIGNNIAIAQCNFIGAGALVVKNTKKNETYAVKQSESLPINSRDFLKLSSIHRSNH
ncbi:hypothetical protein N474_14070 [Pseudoalteromonas luteoviolacea CPMOR-2]|uniref:PglD N-terminal domain-containing protein n=1 Tax=Pseudoalteromonas luteoviolacea DSM 6061 TaxID=1365250 RepID=A0A166VL38_9GAMM|nr:acetyltransferase [Pseudoalteromonas luteoviolacea]KZN32988.1 hypothetical protein N475_20930 [Pseudoalteromonas luteoviolacea DSM 6061]KZN55669.1 hypothetical protein N474_14070 [Pseudoalteromonas luteoviolacea CPMOR-2]MBE0385294.1 hypothetical protein [Pseudoalteromonas luteoviolacea DSM 6061]